MSQSYKKIPCHKDRNPAVKKQANRRIRRIDVYETIACGKAYRKYTNPWDICDWMIRYSWAQYKIDIEVYKKEYENGVCSFDMSKGMDYRKWYTTYKRK